MNLGVLELFVGVFVLIGLGLWIWALADALPRRDEQWEQAGQSKLIWILLLIFLGAVGAIIYFLAARPGLERAKRGA